MNFQTTVLAVAATLALAGTAQAATLDVGFPSNGSTISTANGSQFFFSDGDFVEQSFLDTGIFDLTSLDLALNLDTNILDNGAFVNFEVFVNGASLGGFTINEGDGLGQFDFTFGVADANPLDDDYTLRLEATNNVPGGDGSVSFSETTSFASFTGEPAPVPLPAGLPLMLGAVGALAVMRRKG